MNSKLERMYRTASILTFGGGTNEVQRDIIAMAGLFMLGQDSGFSNSEESTIIRDNIKKLLSNYSSNDYLLKYDEYKLDLELFKELKSKAAIYLI